MGLPQFGEQAAGGEQSLGPESHHRNQSEPDQRQPPAAHRQRAGSRGRRLELLQSQQRCIDAAASADALKTCRQEMKKARKSLKQDYRAYMNKVRNQLGLPARTGNKRDAKGRKLKA